MTEIKRDGEIDNKSKTLKHTKNQLAKKKHRSTDRHTRIQTETRSNLQTRSFSIVFLDSVKCINFPSCKGVCLNLLLVKFDLNKFSF